MAVRIILGGKMDQFKILTVITQNKGLDEAKGKAQKQ